MNIVFLYLKCFLIIHLEMKFMLIINVVTHALKIEVIQKFTYCIYLCISQKILCQIFITKLGMRLIHKSATYTCDSFASD